MPTMTRIANVAVAARIIREEMISARAEGHSDPQEAYILRRDGNTDEIRMDASGRITVTRKAGHITLGMQVDSADLPCIVG